MRPDSGTYARVLSSLLYFGLIARSVEYASFTAFVLVTLTYGLSLR